MFWNPACVATALQKAYDKIRLRCGLHATMNCHIAHAAKAKKEILGDFGTDYCMGHGGLSQRHKM
jgi:hypothetical protein